MISIIICSRRSTISNELSININETIGFDFELIIIDNSENKYSIFKAYNLGISRSKGDYLCFLHDDRLFHTKGWGIILENVFKSNPDYGLIGVAGCSQKTRTPSGWWDCDDKYKSMNIIQHYPNGKVIKEVYGFENTILNEVVVIDGVFFALLKEINIAFDQNLKGFHNYDFNIAIETRKKGYKIGITSQILIEHFSIGNLNEKWLQSIITAHKYYRKYLPMSTSNIIDGNAEAYSSKRLINYFLVIGGNKKTVLGFCLKLFLMEPFNKSIVDLLKKTFKT